MTGVGAKHAFISYVDEDTAEVNRLCEVLEAADIPYWRDRKDLGAGDEWKRTIREAIQNDAVAFIACFSDNSRSRDKSYMNEELTLAVAEYRLRPPGVTWLLPVRFDSGPIPEWDLGAGRTLRDLNYTDLFGDGYAAGAARLITAINRVIGARTSDSPTRRASVEGTPQEARPALLRRLTKDMVLDPGRRIELSDLIQAEARQIAQAVNDDSEFPAYAPSATEAQHLAFVVERAEQLWALTKPFAYSLQVAAQWGAGDALTSFANAIRTVATAGLSLRGGTPALLDLRAAPALCLTMTAAIAATAQSRWEAIRVLIADQRVPAKYDARQPLLLAVQPWTPFNGEREAQAIARSVAVSRETDPSAAQPRVGRYLTPVSEWLEHLLRPVFEDQFTTDDDYIEALERAEVLLGALAQDLSLQEQAEKRFGPTPHWLGRATWSFPYTLAEPVRDLQADLQARGAQWPLLDAGLFGGNPARAERALKVYEENFDAAKRQHY